MDLILHIGTEKTGTSSLQKWLHHNQKNLSIQGVFLSDVIGEINNRALPYCFLNDSDNLNGKYRVRINNYKKKYYPDFLERFQDEVNLARKSHHTMIITSEHFHREFRETKDIENLRFVLSKLFNTILVVGYFREQSALRESRYSTALAQSEINSIDEYQRHVTQEDPYYNCFKSASNWSNAFGRNNVDFRIYDRNRFVDGDIRLDFLTAMPKEVDKSMLSFEVRHLNKSLSLLEGKMFQIINRNVPYYTSEWEPNEINTLYKQIFRNSQSSKFGKITDHRKLEISKEFKTSNDKFVSEFIESKIGFETARSDEDQDLMFSLDEVSVLIEEIAERVISRLTKRILLSEDAEMLREIAGKYVSQQYITREEALAIIKLADRVV